MKGEKDKKVSDAKLKRVLKRHNNGMYFGKSMLSYVAPLTDVIHRKR